MTAPKKSGHDYLVVLEDVADAFPGMTVDALWTLVSEHETTRSAWLRADTDALLGAMVEVINAETRARS